MGGRMIRIKNQSKSPKRRSPAFRATIVVVRGCRIIFDDFPLGDYNLALEIAISTAFEQFLPPLPLTTARRGRTTEPFITYLPPAVSAAQEPAHYLYTDSLITHMYYLIRK